MTIKNRMKLSFMSNEANLSVVRVSGAAFASQVDMTLNELEDIKVALSEGVSNAIVHAYKESSGQIELTMTLLEDGLEFIIQDWGCGIADIEEARQASFSTDPERMGLGFVFMESFMDELEVDSVPGQGTTVRLFKKIGADQKH